MVYDLSLSERMALSTFDLREVCSQEVHYRLYVCWEETSCLDLAMQRSEQQVESNFRDPRREINTDFRRARDLKYFKHSRHATQFIYLLHMMIVQNGQNGGTFLYGTVQERSSN